MVQNTGKKTGTILSFSSYILSGSLIFSPLHKSENIIISVLTAFLTGIICILALVNFFSHNRYRETKKARVSVILPIIVSLLSATASLMLITEVIKDAAYVANRGISFFYYIFLSIAILLVSLYLCLAGKKGIYRFCILAFLSFLFLYIISFLGFATTKSFVFDINFSSSKEILSSAFNGALTGLFFTADSALYIFCFKEFLTDERGKLDKKTLIIAFAISFFMIASYNLSTCFIFGTKLTNSISDPDFALVKLLPGIDFTETISFLRIVSFLIKSSIYIYCSAIILKKVLPQKKGSTVILLEYLLIPALVTVLIIADKNLSYGAFQHLIYPCVILLSLFIILLYSVFQKKHL